ncbi:GNAT family N-acetyltransferase [Enterococcus sp. CWB-B31]|uniref:GNAT family N-acetyltransferase n=1 Tax=Enterococcus sp. CWB-B31 TaxID=2885159 RepID=UPI001E4EEE69|nr:GNAT family N-acetyltransferase [Enterococcus sp. CWB-B31]MCB5956338.1 GNAT family N-acetyltransferase [Enterococcus sp. CWB-B31]
MIIREAILSDAEALHTINQDSLGYDYPLIKTKEQLEDLLNLTDNKLFICTIDDQVCGYIHAAVYLTIYAPKMINILALSVDTAFQGKGCGKELMQFVEKWAAATGAGGIRLNSGEERKAAHHFYEHIGFAKRKNQANYYKMIG